MHYESTYESPFVRKNYEQPKLKSLDEEGNLLGKKVNFFHASKACKRWTQIALIIVSCLIAIIGSSFGATGIFVSPAVLPPQLAHAIGTVGFYGNVFIFTTGCLFAIAGIVLSVFLIKHAIKQSRKEQLMSRLNITD
jgi:hypothetical protein